MDKRDLRRNARLAAGFVMLPVGVALLVLPGPGVPLVVGGLMLLEGEFSWARRARGGIDGVIRRATAVGKRQFNFWRAPAPAPEVAPVQSAPNIPSTDVSVPHL